MNFELIKDKIRNEIDAKRKEINTNNLGKVKEEQTPFNEKTILNIVNKIIDNDIKNEFIKLENKVNKKSFKLKANELKYIKECIEKYNCSKVRTCQLYEEQFNKKITKYQLNNICKEHNIKFNK